MFHKWPPQHWKSVWTNPVNGREALYIASHAFQIDGYDEDESIALLDELVAFCTQPRIRLFPQLVRGRRACSGTSAR
jgi:alpha-ketoglutarate-dependent 2,4-dichlorophenoxyacetate dioxygenase